MLRTETLARRAERPQLQGQMAVTDGEIREAQKLRWRIFADEMGARLRSPEHGVDREQGEQRHEEPREQLPAQRRRRASHRPSR